MDVHMISMLAPRIGYFYVTTESVKKTEENRNGTRVPCIESLVTLKHEFDQRMNAKIDLVGLLKQYGHSFA